MNKKRLPFLISCLVAIFILTATLGILAGCKRSSKPAQQPRQKTPAELAAEKISEYTKPEAVISVHELNNNLKDPSLVILDTRGRSYQVFAATYPFGHIPGAIPILHDEFSHPVFFDRVATPLQLQNCLGGKGVNNQKKIVLYGNDGSQARIYWMLKMYGCEIPIQILDGGFEKWKSAGYEVTGALPAVTPSQFAVNPAKSDPSIYTNLEEVVDSILNYTPNTIIVDARSQNEYLAGHIPCSVNINVNDILNEDLTFKTQSELAAMLAAKGVTPDKKVLVYCNDGVLSSLQWYVIHELMGYPSVKNYDGGFAEWMERELVLEYGEQKLVVKPAQ
ncbi:sulfurtransferase [Pelotomaculum propionicicum]|uniref:Sulfurtransferase n=1 Tax=Pelotomaculum propionicicum TaxID=258475 RepID=A0A4Y7RKY9_9FIRM|nr:rhodanese-like domain-containing protein [Pelotomaculum propionicicum]NLI11033.1 sulfurtransferase [Peptococcaceae bacterium]TEB09471.1 Thiosulfate sulfurtransferase [Pelotomaculum propionicicum]